MKKLFLSMTLIVTLVGLLTACEKKPQLLHFTGSTMGTTYSIKYLAEPDLPKVAEIHKEIDVRLENVNKQMSTYRKDSELSKFNQYKGKEPFPVSADLSKVVVEAIRINSLSDGALDVTIGPLVNLWGFGPDGRIDKSPTSEQITEAKKYTGLEYLSAGNDHLIKTNSELYVDLSSIAKGFAVDALSQYFFDLGIGNFMIEIGGELQLNGLNDNGMPWRIAIEKPTDASRVVQEIVSPGNMGMATSGDYRNYFENNGVRYSHTIDPKTGKPIHHDLASVTVLDPSAMTADALATAFMVMGPEKSLALANQEDIPAFFIIKTKTGFKDIASDTFSKYLLSSQATDEVVGF